MADGVCMALRLAALSRGVCWCWLLERESRGLGVADPPERSPVGYFSPNVISLSSSCPYLLLTTLSTFFLYIVLSNPFGYL